MFQWSKFYYVLEVETESNSLVEVIMTWYFLILWFILKGKGCRSGKYIYALKHTHQLRGMASTLRMRITISPGQWQPWTAVLPLSGLIRLPLPG